MSKTQAKSSQRRLAPMLRASEKINHIFNVISICACVVLAGGVAVFGYHSLGVAIWAVGSCVLFDWLCYLATNTPSRLGKSHAIMTGLLLTLTLPAFVPWWVVMLASAFAILAGKTIFGGVGNYIWQPALVGRFAVAIIVPVVASQANINPQNWPVLSKSHMFFGDITDSAPAENYTSFSEQIPADKANAFAIPPVNSWFKSLTQGSQPKLSSLADISGGTHSKMPALLGKLPPMEDLIWGKRPGGIGETCAMLIMIAGLYLVYRNYVKIELPLSFLLCAWLIAAVMPIELARPDGSQITQSMPLFSSGLGVGFTYANYRILSGSYLLAAFFLAPEMTTRPITRRGQIIFGCGCGILAMLLDMFLPVAIPVYIAVLIMNSATPLIDRFCKPRVFGQ